MKDNIKILGLVCLLFSIWSCSKSKTDAVAPKSTVIGKWIYIQDTLKQYKNGIIIQTDNTGGVNIGSDYFQFNNDSSGVQDSNNNLSSFTYTIKNNTITITEDGNLETGTLYFLTNTTLKISFDDKYSDPSGNQIEVTEMAYFKKGN